MPLLFAAGYVIVAEVAVAAALGDKFTLPWRGSEVALAMWVLGGSTTMLIMLFQNHTWRAALESTLTPTRSIGAILLLTMATVFLNAFSHYKGVLPAISPFAYDPLFSQIDQATHLGVQPWQWLHAVIGVPEVTVVLDRLYYLWFSVSLVTTAGFAWYSGSRHRARCFLAYFMTWALLGSVIPTLLPSAGPCYYALIGLDSSIYGPLMSYLTEVDAHYGLTALSVQRLLWDGYAGVLRSPEGIAAMPSLHVAMPVLFALATRSVVPVVSKFFWGFSVLILIGSVHLGWHYAIDGYVSIVSVPVIWWISGRGVSAFSYHEYA